MIFVFLFLTYFTLYTNLQKYAQEMEFLGMEEKCKIFKIINFSLNNTFNFNRKCSHNSLL